MKEKTGMEKRKKEILEFGKLEEKYFLHQKYRFFRKVKPLCL